MCLPIKPMPKKLMPKKLMVAIFVVLAKVGLVGSLVRSSI